MVLNILVNTVYLCIINVKTTWTEIGKQIWMEKIFSNKYDISTRCRQRCSKLLPREFSSIFLIANSVSLFSHQQRYESRVFIFFKFDNQQITVPSIIPIYSYQNTEKYTFTITVYTLHYIPNVCMGYAYNQIIHIKETIAVDRNTIEYPS